MSAVTERRAGLWVAPEACLHDRLHRVPRGGAVLSLAAVTRAIVPELPRVRAVISSTGSPPAPGEPAPFEGAS